MKSAYLWIAFLGLVCAFCCLPAYGGSGVESETGPVSSCVFLNNLALFANACGVYSAHPVPLPQGSPPDHAGPPDDTGAPDHAGGPKGSPKNNLSMLQQTRGCNPLSGAFNCQLYFVVSP